MVANANDSAVAFGAPVVIGSLLLASVRRSLRQGMFTCAAEPIPSNFAVRAPSVAAVSSIEPRTVRAAAVLDSAVWSWRSLAFGVLAGWLAALRCGVVTGSVVAQCVERSLWLPLGMHAIQLCGAIYCPLNPGDPDQRLTQLMAQTRPAVVLTSHAMRDRMLKCVAAASNAGGVADGTAVALQTAAADDVEPIVLCTDVLVPALLRALSLDRAAAEADAECQRAHGTDSVTSDEAQSSETDEPVEAATSVRISDHHDGLAAAAHLLRTGLDWPDCCCGGVEPRSIAALTLRDEDDGSSSPSVGRPDNFVLSWHGLPRFLSLLLRTRVPPPSVRAHACVSSSRPYPPASTRGRRRI